MARAVELARRGAGWTSPNPLVGAVIVRDGRIIGEGWHHRFGGPHAERRRLRLAASRPAGATAYVTLEPCCHTGKTPPCTEALIEAGIARVVVGVLDPNPLVAGRGNEALRRAGIEVAVGVLEPSCRAVNEPFLHAMEQRRPLVIAKYAMTLDGKVATREGLSRWVTGEAARRRVHEDRHRHAGVMVGIGTALADDPLLTCRLDGREVSQPGARRGRCRRAPSPGIPTDSHGKRGAVIDGRGRGRAAGSPQRPGRARMRGGCGACERRSR